MKTSALYSGIVMHERHEKKYHKFKYPLSYFSIALKELPELNKISPFFSWNRPAWFSFYDSDHGLGDGFGFEKFCQMCLSKAGFEINGFEFVVMGLPRVLGYIFSPISFIYCYKNGRIESMIYEVNNTFNERIFYVLPVLKQPIRQSCEKKMTVSPFFDVSGFYKFRTSELGERVSNTIEYTEGRALKMRALFTGKRHPFSSRQIHKMLVSYPFQSYKIIASIHFEALLLWLKGLPVVKRQSMGSVGIVINEQLEIIK